MSSATQSQPHSAPPVTDEQRRVIAWGDRLLDGVRATAFWATATLPLLLLAGLATGVAGQYPFALAAVLAINVVCAVIGHGHSPER